MDGTLRRTGERTIGQHPEATPEVVAGPRGSVDFATRTRPVRYAAYAHPRRRRLRGRQADTVGRWPDELWVRRASTSANTPEETR